MSRSLTTGTIAALGLALGLMLAGQVVFAGSPLPIPTINDVWQTGNAIDTMKGNIAKYKEYKDYQDSAGKAGNAADQVSKSAKNAESLINLFESYKGLSAGDSGFDPTYNPPGAPEIPTSCPEGSSGSCQTCYADAYDSLNRVRFNLERLRAVRGSTEEFYRASTSFGDNVSGIHGVAGLAWQAERRKIEASFKNFQNVYGKKHAQLMGDLKAALERIAVCEAKYYNEPDWYSRFGFMYYTFMESRYAW
jgi:hypothetical protein